MLRIYCLQQWYALSDPGAEEALYDIQSMRLHLGATARVISMENSAPTTRMKARPSRTLSCSARARRSPRSSTSWGHALIKNRHGLIVQADATQATGKAEREAALGIIDRQDPGSERQLTLAADKGYDTSDFVADLIQKCVTPHIAARSRARRSTAGPHGTRATK